MKTKIIYKNKMQFTKKLDYTIETQKMDISTMDCDGPIPYPTFFTQYMLINTKENFPAYIFFFSVPASITSSSSWHSQKQK